jgi:hypothetical protein
VIKYSRGLFQRRSISGKTLIERRGCTREDGVKMYLGEVGRSAQTETVWYMTENSCENTVVNILGTFQKSDT